jgi:hypothetical protein
MDERRGARPHNFTIKEITQRDGLKDYFTIFVGIFGAGTVISAALCKIDAAIACYTATFVAAALGTIRDKINKRRIQKQNALFPLESQMTDNYIDIKYPHKNP